VVILASFATAVLLALATHALGGGVAQSWARARKPASNNADVEK
jgi:hypothetical protein